MMCTMSDPAPRPHALVVDDETVLAGMVANYLQRAGFRTSTAADGPAALEQAQQDPPDVVVLDLGLPGLDGMDVCAAIRRRSDCYVLMLTARSGEDDKLAGLEAGADDYLTKPFSVRELVARVQAMLRRPRPARVVSEPARSIGLLSLGPAARPVHGRGSQGARTRTEFDVLAALTGRPEAAFSRRELIEAVWGPGWVGDEHLVDVHIGHLRRKLASIADRVYVEAVRGVGYRLGPC